MNNTKLSKRKQKIENAYKVNKKRNLARQLRIIIIKTNSTLQKHYIILVHMKKRKLYQYKDLL